MVRLVKNWRYGVWTMVLACLLSCKHTDESKTSGGSSTSQGSTTPKALWSKKATSDPRAKQTAEKKAAARKAEEKKAADKKAEEQKKEQAKATASSVSTNPAHDAELRAIVDLARRNEWSEAEARAEALYNQDAKDTAVQRVYNWVKTEGPKHREKALEDKIRDVAAQDTRFNPTLESILTDTKNQGLPPRSDLRDAIDKIKSAPYIPETFGKTIQNKETLTSLRDSRGKMSVLLDKKIDVRLDNVTLEQIIFNIGQAEGINFIADKSLPAFQQKLSINAKEMRLGEFLQYVERNLGVAFQVGNGLIWITDGKDPSKNLLQTRVFQLRKGIIMPAQFGATTASKTIVTSGNTRTTTDVSTFENFVADGAPDNSGLETAIRNFYTGEYLINYERNTIIAQGSEEQLRLLERIIETFDHAVQQVLIEARFITVTEGTFLKLGVAWETGKNSFTSRSATDYTGLGGNDTSLGLEESWYGVLGRKSLSATLTAIDQSGESETLSAPRVTLINNLPATIRDGQVQYYYEEYKVERSASQYASSSAVVPNGKPSSLVSGISLNVLASIGNDGKSILLALKPEVTEDVEMVTFATISDRDENGKVTSTFDIKLPQIRKQSLATRVTVKSGQTVAMGGVIQRQQTTFVEAVPVLGKLPLIGAAFRRRTELDLPRYLLVFVTATILSENGEFIIPPEEN